MFETGLINLLATNSDVKGVVGTGSPVMRTDGLTGVYPAKMKEGSILPAAVVQIIAGEDVTGMDGTNRLKFRRVQVDCYGDTYLSAKTLARAVDSCLLGYRGTLSDGTQIHVVNPLLEIDSFEPDTVSYRVIIDFEIGFVVPATGLN